MDIRRWILTIIGIIVFLSIVIILVLQFGVPFFTGKPFVPLRETRGTKPRPTVTLSPTPKGGKTTPKVSLTPTPVVKKETNIIIIPPKDKEKESVLGKNILFTKTQVVQVVRDALFWIGPLQTNRKDLLVVIPQGIQPLTEDRQFAVITTGNLLQVSGSMQTLPKAQDLKAVWGLTDQEIALIKNEKTYLLVDSITVLRE